MSENNKKTWIIIILIVLFLSTLIYAAVGKYKYKKDKEELELKAREQGMIDVISDMYDTASKCQGVVLNPEKDKYIKLISVDCLERKE